MVKIFVRNENLYLEKAGKETHIAHATVEHHPISGYNISAFIRLSNGNKRLEFKQKTYPLVNIKLEDTKREDVSGRWKSYYNTSHKNYYVNYYKF